MNAGTWISLAGAVIAGLGALFALVQARGASRSADAADRQAKAAEVQAKAAEDQVAIMQQQLDYTAADIDRADAPAFAVRSAVIETDSRGQYVALINVEQVGGVALTEVEVAASGNYVRGMDIGDWEGTTQPTVTWRDTGPGTVTELTVSLEYEHIDPINVVLDFTCTEAGPGHRTWRSRVIAVPRHPPPPEPGDWLRRLRDS
jgi:hypothetical protein